MCRTEKIAPGRQREAKVFKAECGRGAFGVASMCRLAEVDDRDGMEDQKQTGLARDEA